MSYEFTAEVYAKVGSLQEGRLLSAAIIAALENKLDILDDGLGSLHEDGRLYLCCAGATLCQEEIEALLGGVAMAQGITLTISYEDRVEFERECLCVGPHSAQAEANYLVECIQRAVGRLVVLGAEERDERGGLKISLLEAMDGTRLEFYCLSNLIKRYAERTKGR